MLWTPEKALDVAVQAGGMSPCAKSKRGVVIWTRVGGVYARGWNHPPEGFRCHGDDACRAACGKVAIHAEMDALINAHRVGIPVGGKEMLHIKVVNGKAVPSGPPSCVHCSKHLIHAGLSGMWLLHEDGLKRYTVQEFHRLTLEHLGLPF